MSIKAPRKRLIAAPTPRRAPAVRGSRVFAELAQGDPAVLNQIANGFERAIKKSFESCPPRGRVTANMVQERFKICERWFRELRGDRQWGVTRILDTLPEVLRVELNGGTFQPDDRTCWMPGDGH